MILRGGMDGGREGGKEQGREGRNKGGREGGREGGGRDEGMKIGKVGEIKTGRTIVEVQMYMCMSVEYSMYLLMKC